MSEPPREAPGLTQLPGAVVTGVLGGLTGQPILIVIVVMNVIMVGSLIWGATEVSKSRSEIINKLIQLCADDDRRNRTNDTLLSPPTVKPHTIKELRTE